MSETEPQFNKQIVFKGELFEVEQEPQPNGKVHELARRAPGVRIIIPDKEESKLLLTREFRTELGAWDYRLPGGKVFDELDTFDAFRESKTNILEPVFEKVKGEGAEEAGIDIKDTQLFKKSTLGATVEWDLYICEATNWEPRPNGQNLEHGEQIETDNWFSYREVEQMILEGEMQEDRVALILLQWIHAQHE